MGMLFLLVMMYILFIRWICFVLWLESVLFLVLMLGNKWSMFFVVMEGCVLVIVVVVDMVGEIGEFVVWFE